MSLLTRLLQPLADYLNKFKGLLYEIERMPDNHPDHAETMEQVADQKEGLNTLKSKLASYSDDIDSTIQHMDSILAQNSSGGRRLTKRRKSRKSRKSRRK